LFDDGRTLPLKFSLALLFACDTNADNALHIAHLRRHRKRTRRGPLPAAFNRTPPPAPALQLARLQLPSTPDTRFAFGADAVDPRSRNGVDPARRRLCVRPQAHDEQNDRADDCRAGAGEPIDGTPREQRSGDQKEREDDERILRGAHGGGDHRRPID
jgi:hypothetical protein